MIRFLVVLLLAFLLYFVLKKLFTPEHKVFGRHEKGPKGRGEIMVKDPVCGIYLPAGDAVVLEVEGEKLFFCSRECAVNYQERNKNV